MELLISGFVVIVAFVHLAVKKEHIIPSLLVYNVVFDVIGYTFNSESSALAMIRAVFLYSSVLVFYSRYGIRITRLNMMIVSFLSFTLFLCFFSSDPIESFRVYLRVAFYLIYFDMVYRYFSKLDSGYEKYFTKLIWVLIAYIIYTILANIFKLGTIYSNLEGVSDGFQTGGIIGDFLLQFSFAILLIPIVFYYVKSRRFKLVYIVFSAASVALLLISARRTSVVIIIIGYLIFLFFYRKRSNMLVYAIGFVLISSVFIGIFKEEIVARYKARADRLQISSFEAEGRTLEYGIVTDIVFSFKDPVTSLMGQDLYIGHGLVPNFSYQRRFHTDYAKILHGSGLIGFLMYALLYTVILVKAFVQRQLRIKGDKFGLHSATLLMLALCKLILTYNGGLHVISFNCIILGTIGLLFAVQNRQMIANKQERDGM